MRTWFVCVKTISSAISVLLRLSRHIYLTKNSGALAQVCCYRHFEEDEKQSRKSSMSKLSASFKGLPDIKTPTQQFIIL